MTTTDPYAAPNLSPATPAPTGADPNPGSAAATHLSAVGTAGPAHGASAPSTEDAVPTEATVAELLDWVGGDAGRARRALDAERSRPHPRKSALGPLEDMAAADEDADDA